MLITLCPHCQTRFRVTTDQLLQRNGTVRCGACHEVFNGGEHLVNNEQKLHEAAAPETKTGTDADVVTTVEPIASIEPIEPTEPDTTVHADAAPSAQPNQEVLEDLETFSKAITDWQEHQHAPTHKSFTDPVDEAGLEYSEIADQDQPDFVQQAEKKKRRNRIWKILLGTGIPLLLIGLGAQLIIQFRNEIAASVPETDPYLRLACAELGCTIKLPAQIKSLSLESSQIKTVSELSNQLELIALLRNNSGTPQQWPSLELQLKDEAGLVMARKVFLPATFAGSAESLKRGIAPNSEQEIRILFALDGGPAADFQLTMFYH